MMQRLLLGLLFGLICGLALILFILADALFNLAERLNEAMIRAQKEKHP